MMSVDQTPSFLFRGILCLCLTSLAQPAASVEVAPLESATRPYDLRFTGMRDDEYAAYSGTTVVRGRLVHDWGSDMHGYLFGNSDWPSGQLRLVVSRLSAEPLPAEMESRFTVYASADAERWVGLDIAPRTQRRMLARLGIPHGDPSNGRNRVCSTELPVTVRIRDYLMFVPGTDAGEDVTTLEQVLTIDGPATFTSCRELGLQPGSATVDGVLLVRGTAEAGSGDGLTLLSDQHIPALWKSWGEDQPPTADNPYMIELTVAEAQKKALLQRLRIPETDLRQGGVPSCGFRVPVTMRIVHDGEHGRPVRVRGSAARVREGVPSHGPAERRPCTREQLRQMQVSEAAIAALHLDEDDTIRAAEDARIKAMLEER